MSRTQGESGEHKACAIMFQTGVKALERHKSGSKAQSATTHLPTPFPCSKQRIICILSHSPSDIRSVVCTVSPSLLCVWTRSFFAPSSDLPTFFRMPGRPFESLRISFLENQCESNERQGQALPGGSPGTASRRPSPLLTALRRSASQGCRNRAHTPPAPPADSFASCGCSAAKRAEQNKAVRSEIRRNRKQHREVFGV